MHNLYPLLYNKAVFEVTQEETGDGVVWARSAWAGNQRYPLHWGGDNSPNCFNMLPQLAGGLSFGLSGFQFWSQDIGGFCGDINENLLIRWMQVGMFISHSRIHGFGDRELYKFAPETLRICRDYIRLRYRLMPYIYGSARQCVAESLPMLRAAGGGIPGRPQRPGTSATNTSSATACWWRRSSAEERTPPRLSARRRVDRLVEQSPPAGRRWLNVDAGHRNAAPLSPRRRHHPHGPGDAIRR